MVEDMVGEDERDMIVDAMYLMAEPVKMAEIAASIRKSNQYTRLIVNELMEAGTVIKTGTNKDARYRLNEHFTN